jgi:hypothetical protein
MKKIFTIIIIIATCKSLSAQVVLNADNVSNNTYELINSFFVRSGSSSTAVEAPDQLKANVSGNSVDGTHTAFGRHIAEVFDATLNKNVFAFYSHVASDNDVSTTSTDRQRVEIKTFGSSPDNLKGVLGEIVRYKWRFKIPTGWQPSSAFTHIHQVKAVDGDDGDPLYTLTLRKGTSGSSSNKFELVYDSGTSGSAIKLLVVDLSLFEGIWVEATETMTIGTGTNGTYSIDIKRLSDQVSLFSFSDMARETIRPANGPTPANSFIRPKWGIYRSIATPADLRDEVLYFSDFSIEELSTLPLVFTSFNATKTLNRVNLQWHTAQEKNVSHFNILSSNDGKLFNVLGKVKANNVSQNSAYYFLDQMPLEGNNYYQLNAIDFDGKIARSEIKSVAFNLEQQSLKVYPNPATNNLNIYGISKNDYLKIVDVTGKIIFTAKNTSTSLDITLDVKSLISGVYQLILVREGKTIFNQKFVKE